MAYPYRYARLNYDYTQLAKMRVVDLTAAVCFCLITLRLLLHNVS